MSIVDKYNARREQERAEQHAIRQAECKRLLALLSSGNAVELKSVLIQLTSGASMEFLVCIDTLSLLYGLIESEEEKTASFLSWIVYGGKPATVKLRSRDLCLVRASDRGCRILTDDNRVDFISDEEIEQIRRAETVQNDT